MKKKPETITLKTQLTQEEVKQLLPSLQFFAETGQLPYCKHCDASDCSCEWNVEEPEETVKPLPCGCDETDYRDCEHDLEQPPAVSNPCVEIPVGSALIYLNLGKILAELLQVNSNTIHHNKTIQQMGGDDLDVVDFVFEVENAYKLDFSDLEVEKIESLTFLEIVRYVHGKLSTGQNAFYLAGMKQGIEDAAKKTSPRFLRGDHESADSPDQAQYIMGYVFGNN